MKPSKPIWPLGEEMKQSLVQLYEKAVITNIAVKGKLGILVQRLIEAKLQPKPTKIQVVGDLIEYFSKLIAVHRLQEPDSPFTQELVFGYEKLMKQRAEDMEIGKFILKMLFAYDVDDLLRLIRELATEKPLSVIFGLHDEL